MSAETARRRPSLQWWMVVVADPDSGERTHFGPFRSEDVADQFAGRVKFGEYPYYGDDGRDLHAWIERLVRP